MKYEMRGNISFISSQAANKAVYVQYSVVVISRPIVLACLCE